MTPQFIMKQSLCRPPHCGDANPEVNRRRAESEIDDLGYAPAYAEPGYRDPAKGVLFANWNYFPRGLDSILEQYGYEIEWQDEWTTCDDCGKAIRTQADCYSWQPYFIQDEAGTVCLDCVDWTEYLESIEDQPSKAVVYKCNPADFGYVRLSEESAFANGWYPGQNDDPAAILKSAHLQGIQRVIFRIPSVGQFDITFETWYHADEN